MTEPERRALREAIDAAQRARSQPLCQWCGEPLGQLRKRYCSDNHRRYAWLKTDKGRRSARDNKRRRRAAARAAQTA